MTLAKRPKHIRIRVMHTCKIIVFLTNSFGNETFRLQIKIWIFSILYDLFYL